MSLYMIFNNIYLADDHYLIIYNKKYYLKIYIQNDKICFKDVFTINTNVMRELCEAYILYQFPFKFLLINNDRLILDFSTYLNSKIIFYIEDDKLLCKIIIDNNIVKEFWTSNLDSSLMKLYLSNVNNPDYLTYIDDIQIYSYERNYILIYLQKNQLSKINKLAKKYNWIIHTEI